YLIVDVNSVQLARLADMLRRKELQTSVGSVLPLAEARAAHQMLDGILAHKLGKNVGQNHRRSFTMWLGLSHIGRRKLMSITAHSRTGGDTGTMGRLPMLVPPLAALLYPFALKGFNISVTHLESGASPLSWLSTAACLALAFAMPLLAMLAAM